MLFVCDSCNTVDHVELAYPQGLEQRNVADGWKCSACQHPRGQWHNRFERKQYDPVKDDVINRVNGIGLG